MAIYVVMERADAAPEKGGDAAFVRQGFHWLAFLVPVFWLLWHRLWIEAAVALGLVLLLSAAGEMAGFGAASSLLALLVSIYFGLEGATLRLRALARRGWTEWGVVEADRIGDAELRYLTSIGDDGEPEAAAPLPVTASHPRPAAFTPRAIGLVPYAGRP
ncbi:MAG: DUF2628 domain-containing protein [Rhizobiaceae bacterium]|jgi:hypothetical protein